MPYIKLTKSSFANITGQLPSKKFRGVSFLNGVSTTDLPLAVADRIAAQIQGTRLCTSAGVDQGPAGSLYRKTTIIPDQTERRAASVVADGANARQLARRLLALTRNGALPIAMATPPTMSAAAAATLTGGQNVDQASPLITYFGTVPGAGVGAVSTDFHASHIDKTGQLAGFRGGCNWNALIWTDADAIEFALFNTSSKYRLFVDEQAVSVTPTALPSGFTRTFQKAVFSDARPRLIRLEMDAACHFGGFRVAANYNLWKANIDTPRAMIVGESYVDGRYGDGTANWLLSFSNQVRYLLGYQDFFQSGSSGEGYLKTGAQSGKKLRDRAATDIIAYKPKHLIVPFGINDVNGTAAFGKTLAQTLQDEVTALYGMLLPALPDTIITVIGPWRAPLLNPSQALSDAIKAGVMAQPEYKADHVGRITFVDTYAENWQQIAGRVGAVSGAGNSNLYIGADNGHFVQAGHDYGARRVANAAIQHLTAFAG